MNKIFQTIGLIGKPNHEGANQTLNQLHNFLLNRGYHLLVEERVAKQLPICCSEVASRSEIGKKADLAIVVGGDGNMLGAAREFSGHDVAVIGVNRGNLGFLTDLHPDDFEEPLSKVLDGEFITEHRFLLEAELIRDGRTLEIHRAMNEVVIHQGKVAHMLEMDVYVDDNFMLGLRADGLILSTPTGSTAYSLSGGGPILTPDLEAIAMVPMYPHTLSSRPTVLNGKSQVRIKFAPQNRSDSMISCDSHIPITVQAGDEVIVRQHPQRLRLIHPTDYNYFEVLRKKLGWGSTLF
ncbi:NAD(+) kinase [Celerinatantimonas sp. MCCC 1A17872]|uniref:NAD(+) kinase n=1 Tax=Celerinatantimonas sp. MCCC 1A17872 TaxID=3177514 RepID=UPI0038C8617A